MSDIFRGLLISATVAFLAWNAGAQPPASAPTEQAQSESAEPPGPFAIDYEVDREAMQRTMAVTIAMGRSGPVNGRRFEIMWNAPQLLDAMPMANQFLDEGRGALTMDDAPLGEPGDIREQNVLGDRHLRN